MIVLGANAENIIPQNLRKITAYMDQHPRAADASSSSILGVVEPVWDLCNDVAGAVRNTVNTVDPEGATSARQILGFPTAFATISGTVGVIEGASQIKTARKVNDFWGMAKGGLSVVSKAATALGGIVYLPSYVLDIMTANNRNPHMVSAASATGRVGSAFFMGSSLFLGLSSALSLFTAAPFRYRLDRQEEGSEIRFLQGFLEISEEEMERMIDGVLTEIENFDETQGMESAREVSEEEESGLNRVLLARVNDDARIDGLSKEDLHMILRLTCRECDKLKAKKEVELERLIGSGNVKILKSGRIGDVDAFIDAIKWENTKAMALSSAVIFLCTASIIGTIASFAVTGGTAAVVLTAIFALLSLASMAVDGYCLLEQLRSPELTTLQKVMLVGTMVLMNAASGAAFMVSGGLSELVMITGISALTTLLLLYVAQRVVNSGSEASPVTV